MKTLFIVFTVLFVVSLFVGCCPKVKADSNGLPEYIQKYQDGNVTCYVYWNHGLSCLRNN